MKIISWNINGLRSVFKKNFADFVENGHADIICLQEIKTQKEISQQNLFTPLAYQFYANYALKKGYSGVAAFVKNKPLKIKKNLGLERFDTEGRMLYLEYPDFTLINLYVPHGGRQKENLAYKLEVYKKFLNYLRKVKNKNVILSGDFNVAHQEIDLARPKQNQNNIMFTPEERKQIDALIKLGFVDTFRKFHPDGGHYTWWPYMANARQRNLGWRIDYIFVSKALAPKLKNAFILKDIVGSDHCPIGIEI